MPNSIVDALKTLNWIAPCRDVLIRLLQDTRLGYYRLSKCLLMRESGMPIQEILDKTGVSQKNRPYARQVIEFTKKVLEELLTSGNPPQEITSSISRQSKGRDGSVLSESVEGQHRQAVTVASASGYQIPTSIFDIKQKIGNTEKKPFNNAAIYMMKLMSVVAQANELKYPAANEDDDLPVYQIYITAYAFTSVPISRNDAFFKLLEKTHKKVHLIVMYPNGHKVLKGTMDYDENIAQNVTAAKDIDANNAKIISSELFRRGAEVVFRGRQTEEMTEEQEFKKKFPDILIDNKNKKHRVSITRSTIRKRRYITGNYPVYDNLGVMSTVKFRVTTKTPDSNIVNVTNWMRMNSSMRWVRWR